MTTDTAAGSGGALGLEFLRGPASETPPPAIPLRAGPLSAALHGIDLAHVATDGIPFLRLLYVAVRDEHWDTIPPRASDLRVDQDDDSFAVSFAARHVTDALDFAWNGRIEGRSDGTLSYEMDGTAARAFRYGRIGLCVLHLADLYGGCRYRASGASGTSEGCLSRTIVPQPLVDGVYVPAAGPFDELAVDLPSGVTAQFAFEGDQFEMEDQRNWTDAAFKTYSTPLSLGLTHDAGPGSALRQRVTVRCSPTGASRPRAPRARAARARAAVEVLEPTGGVWQAIGAACRELPESAGAEAIRRLRLDHHRVDVDLSQGLSADSALGALGAVGARVPVELALTVTAATVGHAADVLRAVQRHAPLARVLVFDPAGETSSPVSLAEVRAAASTCAPGIPVGGGTDLWFAELNRNDPVEGLDLVSFSITPQFHLGDDESLFETLPVQVAAVGGAAAIYPGLPVVVSPVTLSVRDVFAIRAGRAEPVDPRQPSLLCAAWTAGSLANLAESQAHSLTYFELAGPRGLVPGASETFAAGQPAVYPVYHALFDARERSGAAVVATVSSDPGRLAAGACEIGGRREWFVANLTPEPLRVSVGPFHPRTAVTLRLLDAATLGSAMFHPEEFRSAYRAAVVDGGAVEIDLSPYAVCTARCERE